MKTADENKRFKTTTRNWFNTWSNEYDTTLGKISFHRKLLDLIVSVSQVKSNDSVLDIGCGTGLLSLKLSQKTNCRITGIDSSNEMMAIFKDKIKRLKLDSKITCGEMDAEMLDFKKNAFDKIVSSVTLHHIKNKEKLIRSVYKILKPGGIFIVGAVDMDSTGKHTKPQRLKRMLKVFVPEWIAALESAGVKAFTQMFDNGKKHILNDGEYCVSLQQWADFFTRAGFAKVAVKKVPGYSIFGAVVAQKT